ncbi:metallophosphoesterase family protein [Pseudooceanicola sp. MF1-13]|uniref:metallophosphoesterase family protein n=1 Tax=Pseudooceanicola sp. MF1-13 TaxID=3379095 RepID=UPI0038926492
MTLTVDKPLAVIADIHGNALALRAVLADIEALGISQVVNLGDVFSGPLDPAGVWEILRDRDIPCVRGNHDRYLVEMTPAEMWATDRVTHEALADEALDWIRGLPVTLEGDGVYACHATPADDNLYWTERVVAGGVSLAPVEMIERMAEGVTAGLILYAHTHVPRVLRLSDGRVMVNPGSVGCPAYSDEAPAPHVVQVGDPSARYAVVRPGADGPSVEHRAVRYDWDAAADQARGYGREDWAQAVGTGWLDG